MLSAVELHTGPVRGVGIYSHHPPFGRPSAAHLQQMPQVSSTIMQQQKQNSETEFARPKPKSMSGLPSPSAVPLSPTQKYSHHEQNGPVNLAVSHQNSRGPSPASSEQLDQKEIDVVGLGNSSTNMIGSPMSYVTQSPRLSSYPTGLGTNAYQALNYSFYGSRYGAPLFPHRSAYPQHSSRPTYLPPQLDSYPSYLSASVPSYSTNSAGGYSVSSPQLPSNPEVSSSFKASSERSHSMPSSNNGHHPYSMKEKDVKQAASRAANDPRNNNFKVPSGKEGSLKHRILTTSRPPVDKHGTINHPANRSSHNNSSLLNFTRGSLIELSNGSLRRVEDLRTEDFIMSAEKSTDLQLADSTVVKILSSNNNCVMITFSYDNNRSKVDIEAKLEHPFFVYGQGWASCNPDGSLGAFGLKCQRLQVGDVCISLKLREQKLESQLSPVPQKRNMYHHQMQQREMYYQQAKEQQLQQHQQQQQQQHQQQLDSLPQNLSRRASTNSASTTDAASLAQMAKYSPAFYNLHMSLFAAASQGRLPASYADILNDDASHQQHDLNTFMNNNNSSDQLVQSNLCSPSQDADEISRKRRWSAPDIDEDQALLQQQQQLNQTKN